MAVPSDFTITQLVTQGLKRGGITNPASAQITEATDFFLREVTKDIHLFTGGVPELLTTGVDTCVIGQTAYPWPTAAEEIRSLVLLDGPDDWSGTATAGGATSITLASALSEDQTTLRGKRIVITGGTGVDQINQIVAWNNSSKVATVADTWTTNPASGSTYTIANYQRKLFGKSKPYEFDIQVAPYGLGTPTYASMQGRYAWLNSAPDRTYLLWWDYYQDIDRIDQAGSPYLRFVRHYSNIVIEGVAAKAMDRYDDDRASTQLIKYNGMLANLAEDNSTVGQVNFTDV